MEFFALPGGATARARRGSHPGVRRWRRGDRARGDRAAPRARRGAHLQPRGRPPSRARGNDPADPRRVGAASRCRSERGTGATRAGRARRRGATGELARSARRGRERRSRSACERRWREDVARAPAPIVGFTGTGGAGKSSVVDEVVRRLRRDHPQLTIGCLLVDPTRRRTGGALLGDRIRMNAIGAARRLRALARDAPGAPGALAGGARRSGGVAGRRTSTSCSSRPPASARATRRSPSSPTSRST